MHVKLAENKRKNVASNGQGTNATAKENEIQHILQRKLKMAEVYSGSDKEPTTFHETEGEDRKKEEGSIK